MVKKKPKKFLCWDCENHYSLIMCKSFKNMSVPTRMFCIYIKFARIAFLKGIRSMTEN